MMRDLRLAEPLPVMLWRARPDLSCDYLSQEWLEFTGCSAEQALGDGWSRGVHPEDLARWLDTLLAAFDAREPYEVEYRLRRRDGEYRWVLDRGQPRYAADGTFLGFTGGCLDIHERKRAEQALSNALTSALDAVKANARVQERIISSLLDLARLGGSQPLLSGVRVLIVDADAAERETLSRVLGTAGAQTQAAASRAEALQALDAFHPDVLLSDSRNGKEYMHVRSLPAGVDAQLARPVEPVALLATVARLAQPAAM